MRSGILAFLLYMMLSDNANAVSDLIQREIKNAVKIGSGKFSYYMWDIYEAELYSTGEGWSKDKPFALKLHYLRNLKGKDIAVRSVEEMRKQGHVNEVKLAGWFAQMENIFPDVEKGTELIGFYTPGDNCRFYHGDKMIGVIQDLEFCKSFFDIWLGKRTSDKDLRAKLIGETSRLYITKDHAYSMQ